MGSNPTPRTTLVQLLIPVSNVDAVNQHFVEMVVIDVRLVLSVLRIFFRAFSLASCKMWVLRLLMAFRRLSMRMTSE